jgi:phosphoglucosamine mutase
MKLFGTDGVRGKAGIFLDAITTMKLAMSAGIFFRKNSYTNKILVGKDTRKSGYMIENALVSGLTAVGYDVIQIGPMPTPAIAYLTQSMRCDAGIMISASHNSYDDNGIKFFDMYGNKLNNASEKKIEEIYENDKLIKDSFQIDKKIGYSKRIDDVIGRYIVSIKNSFPNNLTLNKLTIVLDCANGAGYKVGPTILEELGAKVIVINNEPNGYNINQDCGALHPKKIGKIVLQNSADIGIALDGDADRLVIIDEKGQMIHGDKLLGVLSTYLKSEDLLKGNGCVSTVMSNQALEDYLNKNGINLYRTDVGDKNVIEEMNNKSINFGGEQSGHIIFSDISKTGDGLVAALQVLALIIKSNKKTSQVLNPFKLYPQKLINIEVKNKIPISEIKGLDNIIKDIKSQGLRQLIRYSGTENKLRVLIEGKDEKMIDKYIVKINKKFKNTL